MMNEPARLDDSAIALSFLDDSLVVIGPERDEKGSVVVTVGSKVSLRTTKALTDLKDYDFEDGETGEHKAGQTALFFAG